MIIQSSVFQEGARIPAQYTCDGIDTHPPLMFSDIPNNAESLVLLMDDPDVPKNIRPDGMWDHWVVFNMPPGTREIAEGVRAPGVYGKNTGGKMAYGGPCPPDREHRYFFKLYALDIILDFSEGVSKADIEQAMEGHVLAKAELMGTYTRQRE
ncbi:YbhB/YbcL family Raf kinase inhibitor-like protein [Candidatus Uhrbacteria bacterium]|nr:YbhB/YbcL family Raf kinase inhibitor-like protein [Candidatus Uhrbacteria bacterium]